MQLHRVAALTVLTLTLTLAECGPARSIALVAQRSSKIPISIRTPFRHTETMIARGYGKRSNAPTPFRILEGLPQDRMARTYGKRIAISQPIDYQNGIQSDRISWDYGKKEANFIDADNSNDNVERFASELNQSESVPIEWVVSELMTNPGLLKAILYKFLDTNKDERLSPQEFLGLNNDIHFNSE